MSANPFGFSTETSGGGDFLPIVKYDARAGRMTRVDRVDVGGQFINEPVDITANFKAMIDLENGETGWISFAGARPDFRLVPIGTPLPPRPADADPAGKPTYNNGLRFMLKLTKECGGDRPIREVAGTAKVFLSGLQDLYLAYLEDKADNPGKLPIVRLVKTVPVTTGSGDRKSTNYQPVFEITGWADRPSDFVFQPKGGAPAPQAAQRSAAPATGSQRVEPPAAKQPALADDDEFG